MIKVENTVKVYDKNGVSCGNEDEVIRVLSDWNDPDMVTISFGKEKRGVRRKDIEAAIQNACNTARY